MPSVAVIDIGTNSILYLFAETNKDSILMSVHQSIKSVRLGKNIDRNGIIKTEPLNLALQVLKFYKNLAIRHSAHQLVTVGTQVFRIAKNSKRIQNAVLRETGLDLEILTENEEAEWSYHGAVYGRSLNSPVIVADIGAGSTELVLGQGNTIMEKESIGIGAVGLTEKFIHHDPVLPEECEEMENYTYSTLKNKISFSPESGRPLIGVGGTVTTLAALELGLKRYRPARIDGYILYLSSIENLINKFKQIPLSERKNLLKLDPNRADIILAGAIILKTLMTLGKLNEITVSDQGLRFGIALRELQLL